MRNDPNKASITVEFHGDEIIIKTRLQRIATAERVAVVSYVKSAIRYFDQHGWEVLTHDAKEDYRRNMDKKFIAAHDTDAMDNRRLDALESGMSRLELMLKDLLDKLGE